MLEVCLTTRLTLLCIAGTRSMREGGFSSASEPLDEGGAQKAGHYHLSGPPPTQIFTSPALAAAQTVVALRLQSNADEMLRDLDYGSWSGRSFSDIHAADAEALSQWVANPASGTPDGESMDAAVARAAVWLDAQSKAETSILAVTHPMIIRAMIAAAINIPVPAVLRIDIAPLSSVVLSFNRMWRLQAIS